MSIVYEVMGRRIREARIKNGLTQENLAQRVSLTRTSITNVEKGRQAIQIHVLYNFAAALNLEPKDLIPLMRELNTEEVAIQENFEEELSKEELSWIKLIKEKK